MHARLGNSQHLPNSEACPDSLSHIRMTGNCLDPLKILYSLIFFDLLPYRIDINMNHVRLESSLCWLPEALAILATLVSIQFWEEELIPPSISFHPRVVQTAADGRCFWTSLWLATQATPTQLWSWTKRARSQTGFAQGDDLMLEKKLVWDWLKNYFNDMPPETKFRVEKAICAEHEDHVSWKYRLGNIFTYSTTDVLC